jgi:signal transduction histidine kinase
MTTQVMATPAAEVVAGLRRRASRVPVWFLLTVCTFGTLGSPSVLATTAEPAGKSTVKYVLILQSFGSDFAPFSALSASFRSDLAHTWPGPVAYHEVALEIARSDAKATEGPFVAYLRAIVAEGTPDLVVLIGGPAVQFGVSHRGDLFPSTPVLIAGVDQRLIPGASLTANDATVAIVHDLPAMVENILRVLPKTENVVVILGASPLERFWRRELDREFRPFENRVRFTYWDDLSLEEMLPHAAALPPRTAIFYALLLVDRAGVPHAFGEALKRLHAGANAPIFGVFDSEFGAGVVGGPLVSIPELSRRSVLAAVGILQGEPPISYRLPPTTPGPPVFDWRELQRWGIRERSLPPGSTVRFRPESAWTLYHWPIVGGLAIIILLTSLVVALNLHRIRRRAAEREVRTLSRRLLTASEEERRWLARELHDDVSQRLARLAIDAARLERDQSVSTGGVDLGSMREAVVSLSADIQALSHRLHPSLLDDLGMVEALRTEVERFSRVESIDVELRLAEPPQRLLPDAALCLYRVAQESLRNVARHARANKVEISLRAKDGGCELEVRDDGIGFDPDQRRGSGLGHASMRERMHLVGGRLAITSAPHRGTAIMAWVPLPGGKP